MADRPTVIVSNRGPVSFARDDQGELVVRRGAGGLVSGLGPILRGTDAVWIAAAMSPADREATAEGVVTADGFRVRLLGFDDVTWHAHYNEVCNEALWFAHHGLWDRVREPAWPPGWATTHPWPAHRAVNEAFAEAVATEAPRDAVVLVQDYHLCLLAPVLRRRRPDLALVHFAHTPFAPPMWLEMLPRAARTELMAGLAAHHACGFHTQAWADDFGASLDASGVLGPDDRRPHVFVAPLGPDAGDLRAVAESEACAAAYAELDDAVGDRQLITRVDRIELSKNLLRGFDAYEALIEDPAFRGRVVFGAFAYPSRQGVAAYDRYARDVRRRVEEINTRFATATWTPIIYDETDDFPRSIAALRRADVLLVNPIRDGLNLVAKEGAVVNERDAVLVLSTEAGAWAELRDVAYSIDPFDVGDTAAQLAAALTADAAERRDRAARWKAASLARTPVDWLADQVRAAG
ncbi:MAG: alpha,alpha-trehalose-phosphate synthase [Acidimicrobiales bacterium]|nr:alpha,alpha-trehalose-phosphate synthase [Acidimicrobiales bacterium]